MLVDAIINLAYLTIAGLVGLFPAGSGFPSEVHSAAIALGGYFQLLSPLVPIPTLVFIVGLVFAFEMVMFSFRTIRWLVGYVPMIGGK